MKFHSDCSYLDWLTDYSLDDGHLFYMTNSYDKTAKVYWEYVHRTSVLNSKVLQAMFK